MVAGSSAILTPVIARTHRLLHFEHPSFIAYLALCG